MIWAGLIYNLMSEKVIGVERTLTDIGPLAKWNKKLLRWVITHNTHTYTRQHTIDLEMVIVSSERVIKVDGQVKHTSMVSFGFQQEFDISPTLYGKIQQDGLTFELYVNGESFTSLSQKEYGYEPPKLEVDLYEPKQEKTLSNNTGIKPPNNPYVFKPQSKKETPPPQPLPKQPVQTNKFVLKEPPKTEDALKSAQDELMRIMIQEKRRKKQMQTQMGKT